MTFRPQWTEHQTKISDYVISRIQPLQGFNLTFHVRDQRPSHLGQHLPCRPKIVSRVSSYRWPRIQQDWHWMTRHCLRERTKTMDLRLGPCPKALCVSRLKLRHHRFVHCNDINEASNNHSRNHDQAVLLTRKPQIFVPLSPPLHCQQPAAKIQIYYYD